MFKGFLVAETISLESVAPPQNLGNQVLLGWYLWQNPAFHLNWEQCSRQVPYRRSPTHYRGLVGWVILSIDGEYTSISRLVIPGFPVSQPISFILKPAQKLDCPTDSSGLKLEIFLETWFLPSGKQSHRFLPSAGKFSCVPTQLDSGRTMTYLDMPLLIPILATAYLLTIYLLLSFAGRNTRGSRSRS